MKEAETGAELSQASEKILDLIASGGPQDTYQLSRKIGDLDTTTKAMGLLIEKELIEERTSIMPNFTGDPYATVYGIKRGSVPGGRLKSW